jgi:hypothetical protein
LGALSAAGVAAACFAQAGKGVSSGMVTVIAGEGGANYICHVTSDLWCSSLEVQVFPPAKAVRELGAGELLTGLGRQASLLKDAGGQYPILAAWGSPGFSSVPTAEALAGQPWSECTLGWPLRWVRIRGMALRAGPLTRAPAWGSPLAGRSAWSLTPGPTAATVGLYTAPIFTAWVALRTLAVSASRRRRLARSLCLRCGYATTAPTCPECGGNPR